MSSSSSGVHYVRGQGSHSMSDSPYYEHFPEELTKLRQKRSHSKTLRKSRSRSSSKTRSNKSGGGSRGSSNSSGPHYVRGQGSHSMSDSPYYEHFPEELKKLRKGRKKSITRKQTKKQLKPCAPNKIRNPLSNRCIQKNGRLAKTLKKKGKL